MIKILKNCVFPCVLVLTLVACHSTGASFKADATKLDSATLINRVTIALYKNGIEPRKGGINITSKNGVVTLSGQLDDLIQMEDALFIIEHVPGVVRVNNQAKVRE